MENTENNIQKNGNELLAKVVGKQIKAGTEVKEPVKKLTINAIIERSEGEFEKALNSTGLNVKRFMRTLITEVRKSEKLTEIAFKNPISIISASLEIASLGLDLAVPNEVALVPYGEEATAQIEYKGLAKLARRSASEAGSPLKVLDHFCIYKNDFYARAQGDKPFVKYSAPPFGEDRGELIGFCAVARDTNGTVNFVEMTTQEVRDHQNKFSKGVKSSRSPFSNGQNFEAYGLKTVLRRLITRHLSMGVTWGNVIELEQRQEEKYIDVVENSTVGTQSTQIDPHGESGSLSHSLATDA